MKKTKKILAIVLSVIMIFSIFPSAVLATEADVTGMTAETAAEAVDVSSEEQEVESTVEDVSEEEMEASSEQGAETTDEETVEPATETDEVPVQGMETADEEKVEGPITLTENGDDYTVTATFDASSGLPAGVQMKVSEIKESGENAKQYEDLYDQTLEAVQKDTKTEVELTYARFFDISFHTESGEVEPSGPVSVNIKYDEAIDVESSDAVSVYHFDEQKEEIRSMDIETAGSGESVDEISFETDGFSIYAVVGTTDPVAESRMTLNFYRRASDPEHDTLIATVYVKNSDSEEDLEKIIYDPGAGELESGQLFKGWIEKRGYTVTDANSEEKKSIPDIRSWAEEEEITENEEHNFYAMVFNTFSVVYKDEDGITIRSEALIFDGTNTTYTIDQLYTPADQDEEFQGWIPNDADLVTPKDVSLAPPYKNGTEVTISGNVILSVSAPKGHWLNFEGNGKGATYTPPQFIVNNSDDGQTETIEPDPAPTRNGYQFAGWYTGEPETEGGDPTGSLFTFDQSLGQNTTLYAKWTQNPTAKYSVIIWKQRADDDVDASDNEKKYDVAEVKQFEGIPGTSASSIVTQTGKDVKTGRGANHDEIKKNFKIDNEEWELTGFHAGRYDQDITIDPEGTSVVNVYYDRNLITISFDASNYYGSYYIKDSVTDTYVHTVEYTGLYDSELSFTWPTQYYYYYWGNYVSLGATLWTDGTPLTFLGSFKLPTPENVFISLTLYSSGTRLIRFIRQKPDGKWPGINDTKYVVEISVANRNFEFSEKFAGYSLFQYKIGEYTTDNSGWNKADVGQTVSGYSQSYPLNIRFLLNKYKITFMDGTYFNGEGAILQEANPHSLREIEGINYQASLADYNKDGGNYYDPTNPPENVPKFDPPGYYFAGWYLDSTCTQECIFDKMPENGITVYAKWIQKQYRVFLHPNVPLNDKSFNMGNQSTSFLLDYGEKVANGNPIKAQRDTYELIGWYTDPDCKHPFNFEIYEVNDTNVITPYYRTEETELDKYGNVEQGQARVNKDAVNNRIWVNRKLELYAKWRSTLDGAKGIDVIYDAGEGTNAPTDGLQYLDNTEANAGAASTPKDPEKQQFKYWVVQQWDNTQNKYVDTDPKKTVYPGDVFTVLKANAKVEVTEWVNPDNDTDVKVIENLDPGTTPPDEMHTKIKTAKYTVSLRAEYGDKDAPKPTHIYWYANNGTGDIVPYDNLKINKAIDIVKPEGKITNNGRKFLGWARLTEVSNDQGKVTTIGGESPDHLAVDLSEEKLFLEWDAEKEKFLATEETQQYGYNPGDVVTQIAADEKDPYHGMVAVWAAQYGVYHSSTGETDWYDWPATNVNLTELVADSCLYGGYYDYVEGPGTHKGAAITEKPGTDMTPEKGKVYYLKEVDGNYLRPNVYLVYSRIHNGLIRDLYGFVNVDSIEDYPERGLIVDGEDKPIGKDSMVSESIVVIRDGETYATLTPKGLFNQTEAYFGYTSLTGKISGNVKVTITGYYITKDKVKVTGYKDRIIRFAEDDLRYGKPLFTGWGSGDGQTLCGLKTRDQTNEFIQGKVFSTAGLLSVRKTLTLMAPSDQLEYTITKVYDTGTEEQTVQEGNHTGEVNYTPKDGYLFAGWYTDQAFTEPADFSNVQSDMTVYARFVNKNDISLTLSRKSQKSGKTTFNAVVTVKDKINLENVTISVDGTDKVLSDGTVKKTGSGKYMRYTTRYNGAVVVYGLSMFDSFTTSVGWTTPDGTVVTGPAWKCTYFLGMVSVK